MDRLAARGMRFPNGYAAAPVCSPSRYSIQFGQTPARLGKTLVRGPNRVDHSQLTLPKALKQIHPRYACAHFGKWHIAAPPEALGFDVSDGQTTNKEGAFTNGTAKEWSGYAADDPKQIRAITERGVRFIREQSEAGRPFFVQLSHYAVHSDIVFRAETRMEAKKWRGTRGHKDAGFAAMLKDLDDGIGRLLEAYDSLGLAETTYIFFVSDNGGVPVIPPYRSSGAAYKNGLNDPLRRGKWDLTEGGIRVPWFVSGPGVSSGSECAASVITYDLLPTIVDLAGKPSLVDSRMDGASFAPMLRDPTRSAMQRPLGDTLIFHFPHYNLLGLGEPHSAIRRGRYKLLYFHISRRGLLFDLQDDIGERRDLALNLPQVARGLQEELLNYLKSVDAEVAEESITWTRGDSGNMRTKFLEEFSD